MPQYDYPAHSCEVYCKERGGVLAAIQGVKVQMDYLHLATYNKGQDKNKIQKKNIWNLRNWVHTLNY